VFVEVVAPTVYLSAKSASGKCWYIKQNPTLGRVEYASNGAATCLAASNAGLVYAPKW
jgi:hypothetical protein